MDPQADSDEDFVVLSTSDHTESVSYVLFAYAVASRLASNAKLLAKSIGFLPSLLGARVTEFQASGTARTHIRKYSETIERQIADHRSVTNYNYIINGGRGGSGGEGGDQGGDGGAGQGPTVYFGQLRDQETSDFRTIRRGDLKLVKEVRLSPQSGIVGRQSRGVGVRRTVYHAEIRGDPGTVTVAVYQGDGAEEEWRKDVAKYESIWHNNIMQLYGIVSTKGLHAVVFHDELIPYAQFLRHFQHSAILTPYIIGYCDATNYLSEVFQKPLDYVSLPAWVRPSTGKLCLDLAQPEHESSRGSRFGLFLAINGLRLETVSISLDVHHSEDILISSLSGDQYHGLCSQYPIARVHSFQTSTEHPVGPGVFRSHFQHGTWVRITEPLQIPPEAEPHWDHIDAPGELLPNSWLRYDSGRTYPLRLELQLCSPPYDIHKAWLAQANRIFAELKEEVHVEDYVCAYGVEFILRIADECHMPEGYLFICPPQDFCIEPHLYQWPPCPVYWSLDPSGAERLSTEDARILGFPAIHIETRIVGFSWDRSVYEGLRRFHEGKGCNPESQEVARQLGYPLYELLGDLSSEVPFPVHRVGDWPFPEWCKQDDPALCRSLGHYL
ncbi:hypothetical protein MSAN_01507100 [Mycena sanguinolenta]|uniref:Uncharacterized protein n=1 Tax=Mycena sanguinolenta TaxID=230812 RepID=A0A8H6Y7D0_9AGAR|nr:hypothetical protein MSAN_01507100 [Mycena sanguinolenta]